MRGSNAHRMERTTAALIRTLVVDDNATLLKVWQRVLNDGTHQAIVTSDPREALEAVDRGPVDVVVCDIVMPMMDGLLFAKQVRSLHPEVIIVLTTAYPCKFEDMNLGLGPRDIFFLAKPYVDVEQVREFIDGLVTGGPTQLFPSIVSRDGTRIHLVTPPAK